MTETKTMKDDLKFIKDAATAIRNTFDNRDAVLGTIDVLHVADRMEAYADARLAQEADDA